MRETFGRLAERVCREQGFELLPSGARVALSGGRSQVVAMEQFEFQGRERLRLWTRIGPEEGLGSVRMEAALRVNARLPHGAFGLRDGALVLGKTYALDEIDAEELEFALRFLAETADEYEKTIFGTDEN